MSEIRVTDYERQQAKLRQQVADETGRIYDLMAKATDAFLQHENRRRAGDPLEKYVVFSDAFIAEYLAMAGVRVLPPGRLESSLLATVRARLVELKDLAIATSDFELISKLQLWACGLEGAVIAHEALASAEGSHE